MQQTGQKGKFRKEEKSSGDRVAGRNNPGSYMGCYMYIARIENSLGGVNAMAGMKGSDNAMKEKVPTETYPGSKILMEHPQTDTLIRKCYPGIHSLYED